LISLKVSGDESVFLLPGMDMFTASNVAERVVPPISERPVVTGRHNQRQCQLV
jgi:hypothetical protein